MVWKLIEIHQLEKPTRNCDLCGHPIAQLFRVCDDAKTITVGSECVGSLLSPDQRNAVKLSRKRLARAVRQWREQNPPPKEGEDRAQYINRRVTEMANAMSAYHEFCKLNWAIYLRDWRVSNAAAVAKIEAKSKLDYPISYASMTVKAISTAALNEYHSQLETKHNANRFDYVRAVWDVRKI